jgi:hypothetical protein
MRRASSGRASASPIRRASAAGAPGGTRNPFTPSRTISGDPPTAVATTARRMAMASRIAFEIPSAWLADTASAERSRIAGASRRKPRKWTRSATPSCPARRASSGRRTPSPMSASRARGCPRSTSRKAISSSVCPFTGWCMFAMQVIHWPSGSRGSSASRATRSSSSRSTPFRTTATRSGWAPSRITRSRMQTAFTSTRSAFAAARRVSGRR